MVLSSTQVIYPIIDHLMRFNFIITILINIFPLGTFIKVYKEKEEYTNISKSTILTGLLKNLLLAVYWEYQLEDLCSSCYSICTLFSIIYIIWYLYYEAKKKFGKFLLYSAAASQLIIVIAIILFICYLELGDIEMGALTLFINILCYFILFNDKKKDLKEKNYNIIYNILELIKYGGWLYFSSLIKDYFFIICSGLGFFLYISFIIAWLIIFRKQRKNTSEENEKELIEIKEEDKEK